jgi:hypothetical protein
MGKKNGFMGSVVFQLSMYRLGIVCVRQITSRLASSVLLPQSVCMVEVQRHAPCPTTHCIHMSLAYRRHCPSQWFFYFSVQGHPNSVLGTTRARFGFCHQRLITSLLFQISCVVLGQKSKCVPRGSKRDQVWENLPYYILPSPLTRLKWHSPPCTATPPLTRLKWHSPLCTSTPLSLD